MSVVTDEGRSAIRRILLVAACVFVTSAASAQVGGARTERDGQLPEQPPPLPPLQQTRIQPVEPGRISGSAVGVAGQRQSREQVAPDVVPMARISGRIQNRVESRLRTRIDRNYDPQANATGPFAVAADEARTTRGKR